MKLLRYNQEPVEFTVDELIYVDVGNTAGLLNILIEKDCHKQYFTGYHIKNV